MNFTDKLQLAYQKIAASKNILIVGHTSPDADALSSVGAMIEVAQNLNLNIYAYADHKSNSVYDFISNENLVNSEEPDDLKVYDVILILDCGAISRTGLESRLRNLIESAKEGLINGRPYIIEFDHHEQQESYADLEIRETSKASTTEIIYHFLVNNHLEITKTIADCILIGLMTDTGHFLHANSSREALAVSSEMLLRGASLPKIISKTTHNKTFATLKVWGRVLENMKFNSETGLASSALLETELNELLNPSEKEANADVFGDIVSFLSNLAGVRVAFLVREENGRVKGSLRTNSDEIDVAKIAENWGGGGHKKAAGFSIPGKLKATNTGWTVVKSN
ncbi:MAG: DHH family phosphoesterase [Patescibacteria group bacterium]